MIVSYVHLLKYFLKPHIITMHKFHYNNKYVSYQVMLDVKMSTGINGTLVTKMIHLTTKHMWTHLLEYDVLLYKQLH